MRLTLAMAVACLGILGIATADPAHASIKQHTEIPAQGLGPALTSLAKEFDFQVLYRTEVVGSMRTQGVSGAMTAAEALEHVLSGTGLTYKYLDDETVMIVPVGTVAPASTSEDAQKGNQSQGGDQKKSFWDRFRLSQAPPSSDSSSVLSPQSPALESTQSTVPTGNEVKQPQESLIKLEEIIVTAQKRPERLRAVPGSITAVTTGTLQDLGATRLDDYVARIPNLVVAQIGGANGATQLVIRGLTTGAGGNPTVGVYIDESPFGASTGLGGYTVPDLDPQELERVEVLRGPQGTLYGAGSLGGLLKYVTADPDPSHFFGRVQVDSSTIDGAGSGFGTRAAANVPLAENLALRVSGYDRVDPGYVDNVLTGARNINDTRFYGGRAAVGWGLNDNWTVRLSGLYQHYLGSAPVVDYDSTTFHPFNGDLRQSRSPGTTPVTQNIGADTLLVEGDLGFATLTSASTYNRQRVDFNLDYSTILSPILAPVFGIPTLGFNVATQGAVDKYTQEVRLASPATDQLSWQIGAFYTDETQDVVTNIESIGRLTGAPIGGLPEISNVTVGYDFREVAAFGDVTYHFSSAFDITGGLRYSQNKQRNLTASRGLFGNSTFDTPSRDHALTFLVNPRLRLNENVMIYGRVASGYRPGGPNSAVAGIPPTYEEDKVTNYEVGLKSDLLDRTLSLDLSAFWIDWNNIQIQRVGALGAFIGNGPSAVSKGLEAVTLWRPLHSLEFYANLAYTDAHLTEDLPAGSAIGVSSDRLPLSPHWSGATGLSYSMPLSSGGWSANVGADWRYVGARLGAFPNPGQLRFQLPSYDTVDLRAGISDDRWKFAIYAKNIGDDRGLSSDVNLGVGLTSVSVMQPRTFGVSLAARF